MMNRFFGVCSLVLLLCLAIASTTAMGKRRPPPGGRIAVVGDERLSALRASPELAGKLIRRMGRGTLVAIKGEKTSRQGIAFYKVNVTIRTGGWIQREAVFAPSRTADDGRLFRLIEASEGFDRLARAKLFLDYFSSSDLRPKVLEMYSLAGEEAAIRLSRDAGRRLDEKLMLAGGAPLSSYYLNFNELDRYNRQGITFLFDQATKQFRYDGEGWQELLHRYPRSPQANEARKRLAPPVAVRPN